MSNKRKKSRRKKLRFSARRLRKEYDLLLIEPLKNIDAKPLDLNANIHEWHANISDDEQFRGLHFHLIIEFGKDYPHKPPTVRMCHKFTHPSVLDGYNICLDMLQSEGCWTEEDEAKKLPYRGWSPGYTISSLLLQLQCFLFDTETTGQELMDSLRKSMIEEALGFVCHCGHCAERPTPISSIEVDLFDDDAAERAYFAVVRQTFMKDTRGSTLCELVPGQLVQGYVLGDGNIASIRLPVKGDAPHDALETISKGEFDTRVSKRKKGQLKRLSPFRRRLSLQRNGSEEGSPIMETKMKQDKEGNATEDVAIALGEVPGCGGKSSSNEMFKVKKISDPYEGLTPANLKRVLKTKETSNPGEGSSPGEAPAKAKPSSGLLLGLGKKKGKRRGLGTRAKKRLGSRVSSPPKPVVVDDEDISYIEPIKQLSMTDGPRPPGMSRGFDASVPPGFAPPGSPGIIPGKFAGPGIIPQNHDPFELEAEQLKHDSSEGRRKFSGPSIIPQKDAPFELGAEQLKHDSSEGRNTGGTGDDSDEPDIVLGGVMGDNKKTLPKEGNATGGMENMEILNEDEDAPFSAISCTTPSGPIVNLSRIPMMSQASMVAAQPANDHFPVDQRSVIPGKVTRYDSSPDLHLSPISMNRSSSLINVHGKPESKHATSIIGKKKSRISPKFQPIRSVPKSSGSSGLSDLPPIPGARTSTGPDISVSPMALTKQSSRTHSRARTPGGPDIAMGPIKLWKQSSVTHTDLIPNTQTPVGPEVVLSVVKMAPQNSISHPESHSIFNNRNDEDDLSADSDDAEPVIKLNRPPMISAASLAVEDENSTSFQSENEPGVSPPPPSVLRKQAVPSFENATSPKRKFKLSRSLHMIFDDSSVLGVLCEFLDPASLFNLRLVDESFGPRMDKLQYIALRSYRCFFTLETAASNDSIILGLGVNRMFGKQKNRFTGSMKERKILRKIHPRFDLLSWEAFRNHNVKCDIWKQSFTHFMPIYINERHGARALKKARECIKSIWNERKKDKLVEYVDATCILETIAKMMNSTITELIISKGDCGEGQARLHDSVRAMEVYFYLHHLLLAFMKEEPDILKVANAAVHQFIFDEDARDKECVPDLGEFLVFVAVSQYEWSDVAAAYLHESMQRSILHRLQKYPNLKNLERDDVLSCHRLTLSWKGSHVGRQLLMFQLSFMNEIGAASGLQGNLLDKLLTEYAERNGQPPPGFASRLQEHIRRIYAIDDWKGFFEEVNFCSPSASNICNWLKNAIRLSGARKYHSDYTTKKKKSDWLVQISDRSHFSPKNCMCPGETCKFRTKSWSNKNENSRWKRFIADRPDLEYFHPWKPLSQANLAFKKPVQGKTVRERYDRYLDMLENSDLYRAMHLLTVRKHRDERSQIIRSIKKGQLIKINRFDQNDKRHALLTEPCLGWITVDDRHLMISRVWKDYESRDARVQHVGAASKMIFGSYVAEKKVVNAWANKGGVERIVSNVKPKPQMGRQKSMPKRKSGRESNRDISQPTRPMNRQNTAPPRRRRSLNPPKAHLTHPSFANPQPHQPTSIQPGIQPPKFASQPPGFASQSASQPPGSAPQRASQPPGFVSSEPPGSATYQPLVPVIPSPSMESNSLNHQEEGSVAGRSDRSNSRMRDDLSTSTFPELVSGEESDDETVASEAISEYSDLNYYGNSAEKIAAPNENVDKRDPTKKKKRRKMVRKDSNRSKRSGPQQGKLSRPNSNRKQSSKLSRKNGKRRGPDPSTPCVRVSWLKGRFTREFLERQMMRQGLSPTRVFVERNGNAAYVDFAAHEDASKCLKHAISINGERLRLEYARKYAEFMLGGR